MLRLLEDNTRYDFLFGDKNLIRKVVDIEGEEYTFLFRAAFADDTTANDVMSAWYDAIAHDQGLK